MKQRGLFHLNSYSKQKVENRKMASKKLKKQIFHALLHIIESFVLLAISIYCGFLVYFHGTGARSKGWGIKGIIAKWLYAMEDQGNAALVKAILIGMFGITAAVGFLLLVYHMLHLAPGRTKLGRSVRKQAAPYEKFNQLIENIDMDMEQESVEFGPELRMGARWLLSEEAMRVTRVQRILVEKKGKAAVLSFTDLKGNKMEVAFTREESLHKAVSQMRMRLPDIPVNSTGEKEKASIQKDMDTEADPKESEKIRALAFAAPLRAVAYEYNKELGSESTSGKKQAKMQKKIERQWNVRSASELVERIRRLYLGEKAPEYDSLLPILIRQEKDGKRGFLIQREMEYEWREAFLEMFEKAQELYKEYGIPFPGPEDTLYAWDLVNAGVLAIHGARAGYLNKEEELFWLLETGRLAEIFYHSWEEYAGAFLLGYFFHTFFKEDSPDFEEKWWAGKSEVKEIRGFLRDKAFMACPFLREDGKSGKDLPEHYEPKGHL